MKLKFHGVADYVSRRRKLLNKLQEVGIRTREYLEELQFEEDLVGILGTKSVGRDRYLYYMMLEKLIKDNPVFVVHNGNSGKVLKVNFAHGEELLCCGDKFVLTLESRTKELDPLINLFDGIYDVLQGEKSAWLIGENTRSEVRSIKNFKPVNHFDTKNLVEISQGNITDLVNVQLEKSPRKGLDMASFYSFSSMAGRGFRPVAEFCRRYPIQFTEAIIRTDCSIFPLSLTVERNHNTWEVQAYTARIELRDQNGDFFVEVGKIADKYFVNG